MAKKRILRLGMLAAALAFGLIVAGCLSDDPVGVPNAPLVNVQGNNQIVISWDPVDGADRYEIAFWRTGLDTQGTRTIIGQSNGTTFTHTPAQSVVAGNNPPMLNFHVRAVSGDSRGGWSDGSQVNPVLWTIPPPTITGFTAERDTDRSMVVITWNHLRGAQSYELQIWRSSATGWQTAGTFPVEGVAPTFRIVYPAGNNQVWFRVRASNAPQGTTQAHSILQTGFTPTATDGLVVPP